MRVLYPNTWWDCDEVPEANLSGLARQVSEDYETYTINDKTYEVKKPRVGFVRFEND